MRKTAELAWKTFEKTGSVREYLKYKAKSEEKWDMEAGVELGAFEDRRDCNKDNKI